MRDVRYSVAMSLDGYLAGPAGEVDWLPEDLEMDWGAFVARFDTVVMGRATWDFARAHGGSPGGSDMTTYVCSRGLEPGARDGVVYVTDAVETVSRLRAGEGKEIWLMGGGVLFASLLEAGLVDLVEVALIPVLLGRGIPFHPGAETMSRLALEEVAQPGSGVVLLAYRVGQG